MNNNNTTKARKPPVNFNIVESNQNFTSQAGLVPVMQFLDSLNYSELVKEVLNCKRANNAVYEFTDVIFMAVIGIIGGATSILAISYIWFDKVLLSLSGFLKVPEQSNLNRIFHQFTFPMACSLEEINHKMRQRAWERAISNGQSQPFIASDMWIDVDSTVKTVYGKQEGAEKGYNPKKKGALSYHPLIAFCAATKEILQAWFRCGSAYTSNNTVEFLRQLFVYIPAEKRVIFRADCGYFDGAIFNYLESCKYGYLVKVKMKNLEEMLSQKDWKKVPDHTDWESCEFTYICKDWNKARRFVAVRIESEEKICKNKPVQLKLSETKKYDYFCYVLTEALSPWETHKKYGERATCETWIDEAKNQMGLANIKTSDFWANSALFQCAVMAYNTICWMRICSSNATLKKCEVKTIRTFLIQVAGKLVKNARRLLLKITKFHFCSELWLSWVSLGQS